LVPHAPWWIKERGEKTSKSLQELVEEAHPIIIRKPNPEAVNHVQKEKKRLGRGNLQGEGMKKRLRKNIRKAAYREKKSLGT